MYNQIEIKTDKDRISGYISKFEKGLLQVPAFQRDFVWKNENKVNLFDSIKKNYPIGSLLLWQPDFDTEEEYIDFSGDMLGGYNIPPRKPNSQFILDGFQRLSTLVGCLLHPDKAKEKSIVKNEKEWFDKFNIVYNLQDEVFEINRSKHFNDLKIYQIPIYKLVDAKEFYQFQRRLNIENHPQTESYLSRFEEISLVFQNYEFPSINLYGGTISEAIEIFQRLNSKGAPITTDWVINASLFKQNNSFRLGSEINNLLDELDLYNFKNIKREVILNCITNSFGGIYFDQYSKNNNKRLEVLVADDNFIPTTRKTFNSIKKAVKFLYEDLLVLNAKLLPYNNQLIFIADFFNKVDFPSEKQKFELRKWFWITTYSNYFTIYNLSKQRLAYNKFQHFIEDELINPIYEEPDSNFEAQKFPEKITMGSVRAKALALFLLNYNLNKEDILDIQHNKINSEFIFGYKSFKLFSSKGNMIPANTILDIYPNEYKEYHLNLKSQDVQYLLEKENFNIDLERIFITSEMCELYNSNNITGVLELRRKKIQEAEDRFVSDLGIHYPLELDYFEPFPPYYDRDGQLLFDFDDDDDDELPFSDT